MNDRLQGVCHMEHVRVNLGVICDRLLRMMLIQELLHVILQEVCCAHQLAYRWTLIDITRETELDKATDLRAEVAPLMILKIEKSLSYRLRVICAER